MARSPDPTAWLKDLGRLTGVLELLVHDGKVGRLMAAAWQRWAVQLGVHLLIAEAVSSGPIDADHTG
jgi:hypothetical protein